MKTTNQDLNSKVGGKLVYRFVKWLHITWGELQLEPVGGTTIPETGEVLLHDWKEHQTLLQLSNVRDSFTHFLTKPLFYLFLHVLQESSIHDVCLSTPADTFQLTPFRLTCVPALHMSGVLHKVYVLSDSCMCKYSKNIVQIFCSNWFVLLQTQKILSVKLPDRKVWAATDQ